MTCKRSTDIQENILKILAIDSSAVCASAAIAENGRVKAEYRAENGLTHSQTLLPMIDEIMKMLRLTADDLDAVAVTCGPGSFTGLRIGSATAKGICLAADKPLIEIPTLEAMAYAHHEFPGYAAPIMDARRQQVYTCTYRFENSFPVAVCDQRAADIAEYARDLNRLDAPVLITGDGVPAYKEKLEQLLDIEHSYAAGFCDRVSAGAAAVLACEYYAQGRLSDPDTHAPVYLRKSQAEREREERLAGLRK